MPTVSLDSRTYTFRIRPGFRFSPPSNQPVTAKTFRYTIERASRGRSARGPATSPDIVGLRAFQAGRAKHIAGIVARGKSSAHHTDGAGRCVPAADLAAIFLPCSDWNSDPPNSVARPIARDGPYYVASISSERTVLLRNPNYVGTRPRRPVRIVYSTGTPTSEAVSLADHDDSTTSPTTEARALVSRGGLLDRRYGPGSAAGRNGDGRYLHRPSPAWDAVVLNASRPLFRSIRMRRAVAYALDRVPSRTDSTTFPGVDRPASGRGVWARAPFPLRGDLRAARRLAGGRRHRATLYYCTNGVWVGAIKPNRR